MGAQQLPLFEMKRPAAATTHFTGAGDPSTVRHIPWDAEVAFLVYGRCASVTHKKVDGQLSRQQVVQIHEARLVDTDWAVAKLMDLAAAEEAEADRAARDRAEARGITIVEPIEDDDDQEDPDQ
jgi:hypothetical protein